MRPASVRFALLLAILLALFLAVPRANPMQATQTATPAQAKPAAANPGATTPANTTPSNAAPRNADPNAQTDPNASKPVVKMLAPDRAHEPLLPPRNWMQKTYDIQYTDVNLLARLIQTLQRGSSADRVTTQPALRTITIGTTNPTLLAMAEEVIKQYDVPPPNRDFEITAYMLLMDRAIPPDTGEPPPTLPAGMDAIAKSLQTSMGYAQSKLLDGAIVRAREGHDSSAQGLLTGFDDKMKTPGTWKMSYQAARGETTAKRAAIALYGFQFSLRIPTIVNSMIVWQDIAFNSDVDVTVGQPALVGHSKLGVDEKALVVVLSARSVE